MKKIAEGVVSGYKKMEQGIVDGYKKMEKGVVGGIHQDDGQICGGVFDKGRRVGGGCQKAPGAGAGRPLKGKRPYPSLNRPTVFWTLNASVRVRKFIEKTEMQTKR